LSKLLLCRYGLRYEFLALISSLRVQHKMDEMKETISFAIAAHEYRDRIRMKIPKDCIWKVCVLEVDMSTVS
jgi:hypothetical protein